jgi:hypothetical protein
MPAHEVAAVFTTSSAAGAEVWAVLRRSLAAGSTIPDCPLVLKGLCSSSSGRELLGSWPGSWPVLLAAGKVLVPLLHSFASKRCGRSCPVLIAGKTGSLLPSAACSKDRFPDHHAVLIRLPVLCAIPRMCCS